MRFRFSTRLFWTSVMMNCTSYNERKRKNMTVWTSCTSPNRTFRTSTQTTLGVYDHTSFIARCCCTCFCLRSDISLHRASFSLNKSKTKINKINKIKCNGRTSRCYYYYRNPGMCHNTQHCVERFNITRGKRKEKKKKNKRIYRFKVASLESMSSCLSWTVWTLDRILDRSSCLSLLSSGLLLDT